MVSVGQTKLSGKLVWMMDQLYTVEVKISPRGAGGGAVLGLKFAGYVPLAYPILVKSN